MILLKQFEVYIMDFYAKNKAIDEHQSRVNIQKVVAQVATLTAQVALLTAQLEQMTKGE